MNDENKIELAREIMKSLALVGMKPIEAADYLEEIAKVLRVVATLDEAQALTVKVEL